MRAGPYNNQINQMYLKNKDHIQCNNNCQNFNAQNALNQQYLLNKKNGNQNNNIYQNLKTRHRENRIFTRKRTYKFIKIQKRYKISELEAICIIFNNAQKLGKKNNNKVILFPNVKNI
jgi:hypothetical protein